MSKGRRIAILGAFVLAEHLFAVPRAQAQDKLVFDSRDGNSEFQLVGPFSRSETVSLGNEIFSFKYEDKKFRQQLYWLYVYKFAGRTGEKTFDLLLVKSESGKWTEKKVSVYVDPDTPLPLIDAERWSRGSAGCSAGEVPKMKMLKLAGNELEVQVLLPDCLKR